MVVENFQYFNYEIKKDAKIASKFFHIYQIFINEMCISIRYNFPTMIGKEVANMALYEIKNYIKLLCIRIDHIESYMVDELNTSDEQEINDFIKMYKHRKGLKILIFEMDDEAHIVTYEQMQSFIHTLHVFDYIRQIIENESNKFVVIHNNETSLDVLQTDSYLHKLLGLSK